MLFSIKNILVCTDLSERSDDVLVDAEILRRQLHAEVDILFVSDIGLHLEWATNERNKDTYYGSFVKKIAKDLENKLKDQINRTGIVGNPIFAEGNVVQTINDLIINGEKKYDLLLIGHSSKKESAVEYFLGSVAKKIAASVPVPTIIVKRKLEFNIIASFIDQSRPLDWMVSTSLDFYRLLNYKKIEFISLWHDLPHPFRIEEDISDFSDKLKEDINYFVRKGDDVVVKVLPTRELLVAYHLIRIIDEDKIDLAIVKRNRGKRFHRKILGSETLRLLEMNTCNILVMPV